MQAGNTILHFPKQQKSVPHKFCKSDPERPKATVLEWVRAGYKFPGQLAPFPVPLPPQPTPEPEPPKKPGEPEKGGAQ